LSDVNISSVDMGRKRCQRLGSPRVCNLEASTANVSSIYPLVGWWCQLGKSAANVEASILFAKEGLKKVALVNMFGTWVEGIGTG
jgi:hypothetical protein